MWWLAKKRIALAFVVPAVFLLKSGIAIAEPIDFDFAGQLTGGELLNIPSLR